MNLYKKWLLRRHKKRLEAYEKVPGILKQMDELLEQRAKEIAANPSFPSKEVKEKMASMAKTTLEKKFPNEWTRLVALSQEHNISIDDLAIEVFTTTIVPKVVVETKEELEQSMQEIEKLCTEEADKERAIISKIEGGKHGK